ncbi:MAG TPA: CPBP family intramembrane glutamic endopeptidase [Candidatus Acidoferrum sp.]|nr:CPBP family intramembrane glutamic endopeptidase [Candidatus Acidoferrum sp.]
MSLVAIYYVGAIGVLLPLACVRSYFKFKAGTPIPAKYLQRLNALVMHATMFVVAFLTWRSLRFLMFERAVIGGKEIGYGFATLIAFLAPMIPLWKMRAMTHAEKIYRSMPQASNEMWLWAVVSASAGIVEEIVYRGVLFGILDYWLKNWWAAAILCAIAFALGHSIQGWKGVAIIFVMSVIFQGLVYLTGTLYVAMAVHATYDFIAGVMYLYFWNHGAKEKFAAATAASGAV